MEDRLWRIVTRLIPADKSAPRRTYSDREILAVVLWAALHDRPVAWACLPENWPDARRPGQLPHPSTVSRRSRRPEFAAFFNAAHKSLRESLGPATVAAVIDGQPLRVSDYSRDPDARNGRAYRRFGKGYKLHAVVDFSGVVVGFEVLPLNVNERVPAGRLLTALPSGVRRVLADGNYDSSPLHRLLEGIGVKFYAPPVKLYAGPKSHRRRHVLIRLLKGPFGKRLTNDREHVERQFARIGNVGCGLKGLPNWVRRQHRVQRWVSAKLLLHHAYLLNRRQAA
jgi:hypothetical protein